jgi:exopolyphosphatase/guanosine-5'-triphosphate,3'-diphosphate pyrophosphatase
VARPSEDGFSVVDSFSRITRLGEGVASSGRLSDAAMERTIRALKHCAAKMQRSRVQHSRLVATEACRRAENLDEFARRVEEETGLVLDVITADEEASLALAGCAPLLDEGRQWALVFDIGGGSTELIWVEQEEGIAKVRDVLSIRLGVVTLSEKYGDTIHDVETYNRVVHDLSVMIAPFGARNNISQMMRDREAQVLGTSGTVTTLAAVHLGLTRYDRNQVDGTEMTSNQIQVVTEQLGAMSKRDRSRHPCIGAGRADLVMAGCAILESMRKSWDFQMLRVADRGVREGVLMKMMNKLSDRTYQG